MRYIIKNFNTLIDENIIEFEFGEVLTLIGENGSGKTNILKAINTFSNGAKKMSNYTPQVTTITINNREEIKDKIKDLEITAIDEIRGEEKKNIQTEIEKIKRILSIEKDDNLTIGERHLTLNNDFFSTNKLVSNGKLTNYGIFLVNVSTIAKEKLSISDSYFKHIEPENSNLVLDFSEPSIQRIENTKQNNSRSKIVDLMNGLKQINKHFNGKPETVFIENLSTFEYLKDSYNINSLLSEKDEDRNVLGNIFKFLGNDIYDKAKQIAMLMTSSDSSKNNNEILSEKTSLAERMGKKAKSIFSELNIYARPYFHFDSLNLKIDVRPIKEYTFNNNSSTELNSSGYKAIFNLIIKLFSIIEESNLDKSKRFIILADEIDKNIHPLAQMKLIEFISEKIKGKNIAFIISTHSPFIIDNSPSSKNFVIYRDADGRTIIDNMDKLNNKNIFSSYLLFVKKYLSKNPLAKNFAQNKVLVETKKDEVVEGFKKHIKKMDKSLLETAQFMRFEEYANEVKNSWEEVIEIDFPTTKTDLNAIKTSLEENLVIKISEEDVLALLNDD